MLASKSGDSQLRERSPPSHQRCVLKPGAHVGMSGPRLWFSCFVWGL